MMKYEFKKIVQIVVNHEGWFTVLDSDGFLWIETVKKGKRCWLKLVMPFFEELEVEREVSKNVDL